MKVYITFKQNKLISVLVYCKLLLYTPLSIIYNSVIESFQKASLNASHAFLVTMITVVANLVQISPQSYPDRLVKFDGIL